MNVIRSVAIADVGLLAGVCGSLPGGHFLYFLEESGWVSVREYRSYRCGPSTGGFECTSSTPGVLRSVAFDFDGSATVRGLSPGRYRFDVYPPDLMIEPGSLDVVQHGANEFTVRWRQVP